MINKLSSIIKNLEKKENIKVLFLIESGSRAWGWESEDSDYDIRGIYIQDYNQFKDFKNQINIKEDNLDIELWDIKKFLSLMRKSNPSVWEWLSSDIVYLGNPIRLKFKEKFIEFFSEYSLKKHYISMAKQNFYKYINGIGDTANLKKYLYVIRSVGCVEYIDVFGNPPPKNYKKVIQLLHGDIQIFFDRIIKEKRKTESTEGKRNKDVEKWVLKQLERDLGEEDSSKFKDLDKLFLEVING